jgi:two-component system nitrate/nitrite response regulator NarL
LVFLEISQIEVAAMLTPKDKIPIRVLIAHKVRVVREGLAVMLAGWPDVSIMDVTTDGSGRFRPEDDQSVDIVLLDAPVAMESLAEEIHWLRGSLEGAKVIVIGVRESVDDILACIESGAAAYMPLGGSQEHLLDTICIVHRNEAICPPEVLPLLFERMANLSSQVRAVQASDLDKLTCRQLEILQLISAGMSNKEIASHLNLGLQTVKNYVHEILQKLGVHSRRQATTYTRSLITSQAAPAAAPWTLATSKHIPSAKVSGDI